MEEIIASAFIFIYRSFLISNDLNNFLQFEYLTTKRKSEKIPTKSQKLEENLEFDQIPRDTEKRLLQTHLRTVRYTHISLRYRGVRCYAVETAAATAGIKFDRLSRRIYQRLRVTVNGLLVSI